MYELTASEAATVLSLLSRESGREVGESPPLGIPASTFYATRRRIYDAGWLTDRYVPNPWAIGLAAIDCVLVKPSPADRMRLERTWAASPQTVVLWSGPNVLFGVFFRQGEHPVEVEVGAAISVTAESGSLPVYFDYSRPWSRFVRVERETGYPRSLGHALPPPGKSWSGAVQELTVQDQHGGGLPSRAHLWHASTGLSRAQQRLLERGIVRSRTFLNPESAPPYEGRELGEIIFLTGEFREGVTAGDVLGALNNECRVSPLLLADDGVRVLILALGQVGWNASKRARVSRAASPVAPTLDHSLKNLQMTVERTDSVRKTVDHRYDRLFPLRQRSG